MQAIELDWATLLVRYDMLCIPLKCPYSSIVY